MLEPLLLAAGAAFKLRPVPVVLVRAVLRVCLCLPLHLADPELVLMTELLGLTSVLPHPVDLPGNHWTIGWPSLLSVDLLCSSCASIVPLSTWSLPSCLAVTPPQLLAHHQLQSKLFLLLPATKSHLKYNLVERLAVFKVRLQAMETLPSSLSADYFNS